MILVVGGALEPWNFMTFPSFWEYIIIPTEEVHHFSEGLAASTNQY
jgi:hypothetical protein